MARARRRGGPSVSLFPFLDILSGVIGTFFLIIAGMTVLSLETAVQIIELPRAEAQQKRPYYVDCRAEGVFLPQHPADYLPNHRLERPQAEQNDNAPEAVSTPGVLVTLAEMEQADNLWRRQLQIISDHRTDEYLILLVRQDGLPSFAKARRDAEALGIDVGFSPVASGGGIQLQMPAQPAAVEMEPEFDFELGDVEDDATNAEDK